MTKEVKKKTQTKSTTKEIYETRDKCNQNKTHKRNLKTWDKNKKTLVESSKKEKEKRSIYVYLQ